MNGPSTGRTDTEAAGGPETDHLEPADVPAQPGPVPPNGALVVWLLISAAFVMILNETIMSVALPTLIADLGVTVGTAQWLTSGYLLVMAVVIPITGFLLQRFQPRSIYLASMSLFTVGTVLCASSVGFPMLMIGRIVQASGTAVMVPLLMTSVIRLIPAERRGATMGMMTVVIAVAPAIGPTMSGLILTVLGWRWTFWIVLPIALIALAAGVHWLRITSETRRLPLDVPSVLLSAVAFGGLIFGLSSIGEAARGEAPLPPWLPTIVGAVAMVVFVLRQLRLQRSGLALLDLRPLAHRAFVLSVILVLFGMMSLFGALILLPLYVQDVLHETAFVTGLAVLPGGLVMGLLGPYIGKLYDRIGARPLVVPGTAVLALSLWAFTTLSATSALWMIIAMHVLLVIGLSLMFTPLMTDALGQLPGDLDSHGSAIMATLQQVAGAAGTALFITVMSLASAGTSHGTDVAGAHAAFFCAAVIATVAMPISLLIGKRAPTATA